MICIISSVKVHVTYLLNYCCAMRYRVVKVWLCKSAAVQKSVGMAEWQMMLFLTFDL